VDWIVNEGNRASEVIRRVRALANKTDIEKMPLDVNDVVREAVALVQRDFIRYPGVVANGVGTRSTHDPG